MKELLSTLALQKDKSLALQGHAFAATPKNVPVYFHQFLWVLKIAKTMIKNLDEYLYHTG